MKYCFDKRELKKYYSEIISSYDSYIIYDNKTSSFFDINDNLKNIEGEFILVRSSNDYIFEINDSIGKNNAVSMVENDDIKKILLWPLYVNAKRNIKILSGKELLNINYLKNFNDKIFIKDQFGQLNGIYDISNLKDSSSYIYEYIQNNINNLFLISKRVDILKDSKGKLEYRAFVLNNKIINVSRFTDNYIHDIPLNLIDEFQEKVNSINNMPKCFSIDFFFYKDQNQNTILDICDINTFNASRCYLYNSIFENEKLLFHETISKEYQKNINLCSLNGDVYDNLTNKILRRR